MSSRDLRKPHAVCQIERQIACQIEHQMEAQRRV